MLKLLWGRSGLAPATRQSVTYLFNVFQVLGLTTTQKWRPLYYLYAILTNIGVAAFMLLTFSLSFILLYDQMTIGQLLSSLQIAINVWGLPCKVIAIKLNMQHLREVENILNTLDARCQRRFENQKIQNSITFCNRVTVCYTLFYAFSCFLSFLSSLYTGQPPYSLYMLPLDWRRSQWQFILQTCIEYMLMNYICLHQSMTDSYPVIYIYIIRTHMQILVERVRSLGSWESKNKDTNYQDLKECIKDHQNLIRLYDNIGPIISVTIFAQFAITAIILCTIMINILIFADSTSDQIASASYFLCVLAQTSPCCYQATCLLQDCEQLPLAIMACDWMGQQKRFRHMLTYFMQRSQRPMQLTAMKLFPITLQTSISIIKFSFSLYTLIQSFNLGAKEA